MSFKNFILAFFIGFIFLNCTSSRVSKKVLFLGDSITQDGTYVSIIEYFLSNHQDEVDYNIISIGLSSETVSGLTEAYHPFPRPRLKERLGRALTKVQPDIVVACYGMNDGIYHPQSESRMAAFKNGINELIEKVTKLEAELILVTPPPFDPAPIQEKTIDIAAHSDFSYATPYADYDNVLQDYSDWLLTMENSNVTIIDIHSGMNEELNKQRKKNPDFSFSEDGIHPSSLGHYYIAHTLIPLFGTQIEYSEEQWLRLRYTPLYKLIEQRRKAVSDAWLPYVGFIRKDSFFVDNLNDLAEKQQAFDAAIKKLTKDN